MPIAFQNFWQRAFQHVQLDYSEDVARFLREVMAAVPGMISISGLAVPDSWSEVSEVVPLVLTDWLISV